MFKSFSLAGQAAEIRWAYHRAASLGPWRLSAGGSDGTLTATVIEADTFKLSQPALTLRIPRQNGSVWSYPIQSLHIADGTLTARVSTQE
jgi:hypothetical protein